MQKLRVKSGFTSWYGEMIHTSAEYVHEVIAACVRLQILWVLSQKQLKVSELCEHFALEVPLFDAVKERPCLMVMGCQVCWWVTRFRTACCWSHVVLGAWMRATCDLSQWPAVWAPRSGNMLGPPALQLSTKWTASGRSLLLISHLHRHVTLNHIHGQICQRFESMIFTVVTVIVGVMPQTESSMDFFKLVLM